VTNHTPHAIIVLVVFAVLLCSAVTIQDADAVKASGTKVPAFGKSTQSQVCGDRLCAVTPSTAKDFREKNVEGFVDIDALLSKMDEIHKRHQSQLKEKWKTMTHADKVQLSKNMQQMIAKMEAMDGADHMMKMMSGDHGDHGEKGEMKGGHGEHGEKGEMKGESKGSHSEHGDSKRGHDDAKSEQKQKQEHQDHN